MESVVLKSDSIQVDLLDAVEREAKEEPSEEDLQLDVLRILGIIYSLLHKDAISKEQNIEGLLKTTKGSLSPLHRVLLKSSQLGTKMDLNSLLSHMYDAESEIKQKLKGLLEDEEEDDPEAMSPSRYTQSLLEHAD